MNANDLKDQGNMYFSARKFAEAAKCYTKAIVSITTRITIADLTLEINIVHRVVNSWNSLYEAWNC